MVLALNRIAALIGIFFINAWRYLYFGNTSVTHDNDFHSLAWGAVLHEEKQAKTNFKWTKPMAMTL